MWFAQERSWLRVRPNNLSDLTSLRGFWENRWEGLRYCPFGERVWECVCVWDFSMLKYIFQVFDYFVTPSRSGETEAAAACLSEGWGMSQWSHQQRDKEDFPESQDDHFLRSGIGTLSWGHSSLDRERRWKDSVQNHSLAPRVSEVSNPCVELALDAISR